MAIKTRCPHCDKEYSIQETMAARKVALQAMQYSLRR